MRAVILIFLATSLIFNAYFLIGKTAALEVIIDPYKDIDYDKINVYNLTQECECPRFDNSYYDRYY